MDDPRNLHPGADAALMLAALVESSDDAIFAKEQRGIVCRAEIAKRWREG